jgi:glycerophosphoryl diester phosphodiesterase
MTKPGTVGELRQTGYASRSVKAEIRQNLIHKLERGERIFPGIVGFDETVLPQVENALLSGQDLILLGERGQAKSRLARSLVALLDETVPTLDDVVAVAAKGKARMLLEIKVDASRARYPEIEEKVLALLDRHGMTGSTVVMSFDAPTWRRVRELRPDVAICALYSARTLGRTSLAEELQTLRSAGVRYIGVEHTVVDAAAVAQARAAGIGIGAWTVNDAAGMKRQIDAGAAILITDQPDVAKTLLGR